MDSSPSIADDAGESAGGPVAVIVPEKLKALIVDDNAYARTVAAATLRKLGVGTIDDVGSAPLAIDAILAVRYDIVLMDWYMPEMNGAAMLQIMRGRHFGPHGSVPVVMMTAYPNRETYARAKELGAAEILTKRFATTHMASALGRLVPNGWGLPDDTAGGGQVLL
ncbi:MAG: response regulator [Rhizobiaceae bacterium]|nr:MAG: response regulator [Rhizobiaceae bacterium]